VYRQLTSIANQHGARVVVSAGGRALAESLVACPYLVKPDLRESVSLEGEPVVTVDEIIAAGKKIVSCGVEMIVMTHAVTGDIVITKDAVWEIQARIKTTQLKNLVGADDALLGGIIYQLDRGAAVEDALRFGMATGILSAESEEKICRDIGKIESEMNLISLERLEG
nr:bifunctional hydroxymethylpyrimidine kinase/phosphomethylpyrimidine kinase [Candidatus Bipolaricaulota bacterium]